MSGMPGGGLIILLGDACLVRVVPGGLFALAPAEDARAELIGGGVRVRELALDSSLSPAVWLGVPVAAEPRGVTERLGAAGGVGGCVLMGTLPAAGHGNGIDAACGGGALAASAAGGGEALVVALASAGQGGGGAFCFGREGGAAFGRLGGAAFVLFGSPAG